MSRHFLHLLLTASSKRISRVGAVFALCMFLACVAAPQQLEVIDNARIVELVKAGIGDSVLIPKIESSRVILDASEAGLLELKSAGVSDAVIVSLLERAAVSGYISNGASRDRVELAAGTNVEILTLEKISSRKVSEGQTVAFETAADVTVDGKILIAKGTPVVGIISKVRKPGMAGRGGQLSVTLQSTTSVDNQPIKLRASKSGKGGDNFGTAFSLSYIMGIGLLIPGKNAEIKAGTVFTAYTEETRFVSAR